MGKIEQWKRLSSRRKRLVVDTLLASQDAEIKGFLAALTESVSRKIEEIIVLPLHGAMFQAASIGEARTLLEAYDESVPQARFERYEIHIRFRNKNEIMGKFHDKPSAIEFLETYRG